MRVLCGMVGRLANRAARTKRAHGSSLCLVLAVCVWMWPVGGAHLRARTDHLARAIMCSLCVHEIGGEEIDTAAN